MTLAEARQIVKEMKFPKTVEDRERFLIAINIVAGSFSIPPKKE